MCGVHGEISGRAVLHILTRDSEIKFALAALASAITALAVSDQGVLITASSDADVRVWDLRYSSLR